jgi:hypothetical protein
MYPFTLTTTSSSASKWEVWSVISKCSASALPKHALCSPSDGVAKKGDSFVWDYIDDSFTAARTYNRCLCQSALSALFFGALGAFLRLPKCNLWPQLLLKWLGFLIDSEEQMFKVGDSKIEKLKTALREVLFRPDSSARHLAALAGQLIAVSPAVLPAALYSRSLFMAMRGKITWDEIFPTPESVKDTTQFLVDQPGSLKRPTMVAESR